MMEYRQEDFLQLSGIQHFAFCRRQWALIHVEGLWQDNLRTVEGEILHERAHDNQITEKRAGVILSRGLPIFSRTLGVSGVCDVVELMPSPSGVTLYGRQGTYLPTPVEYKRGTSKQTDADRLQLCCQAMCLEEMFVCEIKKGYLFYGQTKRRECVNLNDSLREQVKSMLTEMHNYFQRRYTPRVKRNKSCRACSLLDLCLPELPQSGAVAAYVEKCMQEEQI